MNVPRLNPSERLRAHMSYRKFAGDTPRLLVLECDYWLDRACIGAAERMGWSVRCAPVSMLGVMSRERIAGLIETLVEFRPDFILSVNLSGMDEEGLFARLFADLHVPYVTWFVDTPRTILLDRDWYGSEWTVALTWDPAYEDYLQQRRFGATYTLPLGTDETLFNRPPLEVPALPPTFIANSMQDFSGQEWEWIAGRPHVAEAIQNAFAAGRITRQNFASGLDAMMGETGTTEWDEHERRHAELYCFIEGTRRSRRALVEALLPDGMRVAGDEAWKTLDAKALPYLNYTLELPAYYQNCLVNLNSTSLQMPVAVNQRVLDCPAAGGFLLTDAQSQLDTLFDTEREAAVYHSLDEAREMLHFYVTNPAARLPIIQAARQRILGEHTYGHRLRHVVSLLKARFGNG